MKVCLLAVLWFLVTSSCSAQIPYTEQQVIDYAKTIDVKTLDSALPSQRLEAWLQSGLPGTHKLTWTVEDTCWQRPVANEDYPLCALIRVSSKDQWAEFLVQVGTLHKGIIGSPHLENEYGISIIGEGLGINQTGYAERLSDLPGFLRQPQAQIIAGVQKLYKEVVARHPIGIPNSTETVTIWPLLSNRLRKRLQTAKACEKDYFKQHQIANSTEKPAWLKMGIFSGSGEWALPTSSFVFSRGPQKDGTFLVEVDLTHTSDPMLGPDQSWRATARVVAEDRRYAVDDVRIFYSKSIDDHIPPDGPSSLLSNSFAGCDGPHWIGLATTNK